MKTKLKKLQADAIVIMMLIFCTKQVLNEKNKKLTDIGFFFGFPIKSGWFFSTDLDILINVCEHQSTSGTKVYGRHILYKSSAA